MTNESKDTIVNAGVYKSEDGCWYSIVEMRDGDIVRLDLPWLDRLSALNYAKCYLGKTYNDLPFFETRSFGDSNLIFWA